MSIVEISRHWVDPLARQKIPMSLNGANIERIPSRKQFEERQALLAQQDYSSIPVPSGFPHHIVSPSVWTPKALNLADITFSLSSSEIQELEIALNTFKEHLERGHTLNELAPLTFPLPTLGPRLRAVSADIHNGRGATIIQGLDPDKYSLKENIIIFGGLSSYIGDSRGAQSAELDVLTHLKATLSVKDVRPCLTRETLPFHSDPGEILALYVVEPAKSGGQTLFASAGHVYNEIARTKPHLIDVLAKSEWPHWTARKPVEKIDFPLLYLDQGGKPFFGFTRYALTGSRASPRPENLPPLSELQADALDTVEFLAAENSLALPQKKGDIYFLSNRSNLHARTAYADDSSDQDRHLLRLLLMDSEYGHALPESLNHRWGHFFDYPQDQAKWILEKEQPESFASASKYEGAYIDESTTHSTN